MKRLILLIGFIALTGALFAQTRQPSLFEYIQTYSQLELLQLNRPNAINTIRHADTTKPEYNVFVDYLTGNHFYSFFQNKKLYMLSYETYISSKANPDITRGLYLFRLDEDGWKKACDEAVQTDYYKLELSIDEPNVPQHNIWSSYTYVPNKIMDDYKGSLTVSANGEVTITLINRKWYYDDKYTAKESFENKTIILIRNDSEIYTIKK